MSAKKKAKEEEVTVQLNDGPKMSLSGFIDATERMKELVSVESRLGSITAPNLQAVALAAVRDLADALTDSEVEISETLSELADNRDDEEKDLKLALGFKITWNLDANRVDTALSWTVKRKREASHDLSEVTEPQLPGIA
jgi:hypothetical protein